MIKKPEKLSSIWAERYLCEQLDVPITKSGKSRQISNWIKGGLKYTEKSGIRYFFEQDVIDYLYGRYNDQWSE